MVFIPLDVVEHSYGPIGVAVRDVERDCLAIVVLGHVEVEFGVVGGERGALETAQPLWDVMEHWCFLALIHHYLYKTWRSGQQHLDVQRTPFNS